MGRTQQPGTALHSEQQVCVDNSWCSNRTQLCRSLQPAQNDPVPIHTGPPLHQGAGVRCRQLGQGIVRQERLDVHPHRPLIDRQTRGIGGSGDMCVNKCKVGRERADVSHQHHVRSLCTEKPSSPKCLPSTRTVHRVRRDLQADLLVVGQQLRVISVQQRVHPCKQTGGSDCSRLQVRRHISISNHV